MAIFSPAADEIVLFRQGKQREDVRRIVLEVAIQGGDQVSAGLMEAGIEGRCLPVIPVEVEDPDFQVVACEFVQQRPAPVSAPVVHVNDLEGADLTGQGFQDLRGQGRQVVPLVIDRDYDGEAGSCGLGHGLPGCSLMRYLIKPADCASSNNPFYAGLFWSLHTPPDSFHRLCCILRGPAPTLSGTWKSYSSTL